VRIGWRRRQALAAWPVSLRDDSTRPQVLLRPLRRDDEAEWHQLRRDNEFHVRPWEPTLPPGVEARAPVPFRQFVRDLDDEALADRALPWCIEVEGRLVGQVHIFGIVRAAQQSAAVGYWLGEADTGRGIATRALALAIDYALGPAKLHRIEVNIRVDNKPSLAMPRRLGLRDEGIRRRYLHIDGAWRDHVSFAITAEELVDAPLISRLSQM